MRLNYMKWLIIILTILVILGVGGLTNYKQEILKCSKKNNLCHVEKTNLFNMKSDKKIAEISDIKKVSYIRQKVKGNLYAKGYTDYQLIFVTQDNSRKIIFSELLKVTQKNIEEIYFDYDSVHKKIVEVRKKLLSDDENFVIYKD